MKIKVQEPSTDCISSCLRGQKPHPDEELLTVMTACNKARLFFQVKLLPALNRMQFNT